jgi:hypothetical protein
MPIISMFYGIIVRLFNFDNQKHKLPHLRAEFHDFEAVFLIETGEILEGNFPGRATKLLQAWIEIHKDELIANWKLAISGEKVFKIKPLD